MKNIQSIMNKPILSCALFFHCLACLIAIPTLLGDDSLTQASWKLVSQNEVKQQLTEWMQQLETPPELKQSVEKLWQKDIHNAAQITNQLNASLALVDAAADKFLKEVHTLSSRTTPQELPKYENKSAPDWVRKHLRTILATSLTHLCLYDEAAEQFAELSPADVIDPASLLFYRSVVEHRLLKKEDCLQTLDELLQNKELVPQRYVTVASLMQADLQPLEPDSLDEISRLMDDVRRRLELGRAGKKVRDEEADIIAKLDKKIEDLEKKRKQQQQQKSQQAQNSQKPAEKSQLKGDLQATDETDPKRFSKAEQWGNLPPKQRQQALQQLGRDLPAHFRDIIEEYFKRLAQDGNQ
jgi:hypothetical protein